MIIEGIQRNGFWLNLWKEEPVKDPKQVKTYVDELYGFRAFSTNKTSAWLAIRARCRRLNIEKPTFDKIKLVEDE